MVPLEDDQIVYRTLTRGSEFKDGRVFSKAFIRRATDTDGLSVDFNVLVPDGCAPELNGKRAVLRLEAGQVRRSPTAPYVLDLIADADHHANIVNAPQQHPPEDPVEDAERVAAVLVEKSHVVWDRGRDDECGCTYIA